MSYKEKLNNLHESLEEGINRWDEIGHWDNKSEAERQKKALERKGYICKIKYALYAKEGINRWDEIGHWDNKSEAERQKKTLERKGYICKIEYALYAKNTE